MNVSVSLQTTVNSLYPTLPTVGSVLYIWAWTDDDWMRCRALKQMLSNPARAPPRALTERQYGEDRKHKITAYAGTHAGVSRLLKGWTTLAAGLCRGKHDSTI